MTTYATISEIQAICQSTFLFSYLSASETVEVSSVKHKSGIERSWVNSLSSSSSLSQGGSQVVSASLISFNVVFADESGSAVRMSCFVWPGSTALLMF